MKLELYYWESCPFCQKVFMFLETKKDNKYKGVLIMINRLITFGTLSILLTIFYVSFSSTEIKEIEYRKIANNDYNSSNNVDIKYSIDKSVIVDRSDVVVTDDESFDNQDEQNEQDDYEDNSTPTIINCLPGMVCN